MASLALFVIAILLFLNQVKTLHLYQILFFIQKKNSFFLICLKDLTYRLC